MRRENQLHDFDRQDLIIKAEPGQDLGLQILSSVNMISNNNVKAPLPICRFGDSRPEVGDSTERPSIRWTWRSVPHT